MRRGAETVIWSNREASRRKKIVQLFARPLNGESPFFLLLIRELPNRGAVIASAFVGREKSFESGF